MHTLVIVGYRESTAPAYEKEMFTRWFSFLKAYAVGKGYRSDKDPSRGPDLYLEFAYNVDLQPRGDVKILHEYLRGHTLLVKQQRPEIEAVLWVLPYERTDFSDQHGWIGYWWLGDVDGKFGPGEPWTGFAPKPRLPKPSWFYGYPTDLAISGACFTMGHQSEHRIIGIPANKERTYIIDKHLLYKYMQESYVSWFFQKIPRVDELLDWKVP